MTINKQMLAAALVTTISAGSIIGISAASAHNGSGDGERAAALAEKLGVEQSAVEGAFSELKEEHQAEREAENAEKLAGLVAEGTLTQAQADALTVKHEEMQAAREALRDQDLTQDEMREQMETSREEFKAWADDQGINLDDIRPEKGEGYGHRRGHHLEQE